MVISVKKKKELYYSRQKFNLKVNQDDSTKDEYKFHTTKIIKRNKAEDLFDETFEDIQ